MIARFWHGRTRKSDADEYVAYVRGTGVEAHCATPGNRASMILRRDEGDETHFMVLSFWDSFEAIKGFAGEVPETAIYFPEDGRYLLEFEPEVQHYEVAVEGRPETVRETHAKTA